MAAARRSTRRATRLKPKDRTEAASKNSSTARGGSHTSCSPRRGRPCCRELHRVPPHKLVQTKRPITVVIVPLQDAAPKAAGESLVVVYAELVPDRVREPAELGAAKLSVSVGVERLEKSLGGVALAAPQPVPLVPFLFLKQVSHLKLFFFQRCNQKLRALFSLTFMCTVRPH